MKNLFHWVFVATLLAVCPFAVNAQAQPAKASGVRIGIVNTKKCLEESKLGKQEQANFEKMKNQMESVLQEKEKSLQEIEAKLDNPDYMDSVSDEVALDLQKKKQNLRKDGMALQNQYMQTLQQANMKIVQKLTETITKASSLAAKDPANELDLVLSEDATAFYAPNLDVTEKVVAKMNELFDKEQKEAKK